MTPNNELGYGIPNFTSTLNPVLATDSEQEVVTNYRVFPNPIERGKLFIESKTRDLLDPVDVYVYNSTGQLMMQDRFVSSSDPTITLDTSTLGQGVYILHILSPSVSDTVKVIKF